MLIQKRGSARLKWFPKIASTRFDLGDAVVFNTVGTIQPVVAASTTVVGYIKRNVLSTDADYATTALVPVQTCVAYDEVEIDCSATVTSAMIGTTRDFSNASTLNTTSAGSLNIVRILRIGSSTSKAVVSFLKNGLTD
jgi:hypothetical protein